MPKRISNYIRRRQASYTLPAVLAAHEIGRPLNTFITINMEHLGVGGEDACALNESLRRWASHWLKRPKKAARYKSTPLTLMWVMENTGGIGVHWAIHLPRGAKKAFETALKLRLSSAYSESYRANTVKQKPIKNMLGLRKYFLKGMDDEIGKLFRVRTSPQGPILGKRFGVTQDIGPSVIANMEIKKRRSELMRKHFPSARIA